MLADKAEAADARVLTANRAPLAKLMTGYGENSDEKADLN